MIRLWSFEVGSLGATCRAVSAGRQVDDGKREVARREAWSAVDEGKSSEGVSTVGKAMCLHTRSLW